MTSYIKLLNKIEAFCNAHYQIQRFGGEFREQMPNISTESEKYPIVFVSPSNGSPYYDTNQITVDVYCVDIIQKGRDNINTIVSDCHLILTDLYGYFSQGSDLTIDVIGTPSQSPLNNLDLDYVAGWMMSITFEVDGYCVDAIPMTPITGSDICEDATVIITDDDASVLYTLTVESGATDTQIITDSTAVLKDTENTTISTTSINAQASANITAPDSTYSITDDSANVLYSGNIVSGGSLSQVITDSVVTLNDTLAGLISTTNVNAQSPATIVAPDANIQNSDATYNVDEVSGGALVLPDSQINVDSVNEGDVVSVKTIDINLTNDAGVEVTSNTTITGNSVDIQVTTDHWLYLFISSSASASIAIRTKNTLNYQIDWGQGGVVSVANNATSSVAYSPNYSGAVQIRGLNSSRAQIDGIFSVLGAWNFDIKIIKEQCHDMTYEVFFLGGSMTLSGDIANLPSGLTYRVFFLGGSMALSGDIANLPSGLTSEVYFLGYSMTLSGDIANLPSGLTFRVYFNGYSMTLSGDIANLPSGLTYEVFFNGNSMTLSGDIANLPSGLTYRVYFNGNSMTLSGDIASVPANITYLYLNTNLATYTYTSGRVWKNMTMVYIRPAATYMTATEVDNIFIDLDASPLVTGAGTLDLRGNCAAPTAASLTARNSLVSKGKTVLTN